MILTAHMLGTFKINGDKLQVTEWVALKTVEVCSTVKSEKNDPEGTFVFVIFNLLLSVSGRKTKMLRDAYFILHARLLRKAKSGLS